MIYLPLVDWFEKRFSKIHIRFREEWNLAHIKNRHDREKELIWNPQNSWDALKNAEIEWELNRRFTQNLSNAELRKLSDLEDLYREKRRKDEDQS